MSEQRFNGILVLLLMAALTPGLASTRLARADAAFTVNSTADAVDAKPGDGHCATQAATCTLRAAIQESNALSGADTISLPSGSYDILIDGTDENAAATGDLDITDSLTITGAGAESTIIDLHQIDRGFEIFPPAIVTITGVTIRNAYVEYGSGGGIFNDGTLTVSNSIFRSNSAVHGGGISSYGTLTVTLTSFVNNTASINGGGIDSIGDLTVSHSTFNFNNATFRGGGINNYLGTLHVVDSWITDNNGHAYGGGITNDEGVLFVAGSTISNNITSDLGGGIRNNGAATLINSTITGNSATNTGGGIDSTGTITLTNVTLTANAAPNGSGIFNRATARLINSIVAKNGSGGNCSGLIESAGHNMDSGATCGFNAAGDISNTDPLLGPLQANGGTTPTQALLAGSPAIDSGSNNACPPTDQRGIIRPQDGNGDGTAVCDLGAFEVPDTTSIGIAGTIHDASGLPVPGVTVASAGSGSVTTDSAGKYQLSGLAAGTYTITPVKSGYSFTPPSRTITIPPNVQDQDFAATLIPARPAYLPLLTRAIPIVGCNDVEPNDDQTQARPFTTIGTTCSGSLQDDPVGEDDWYVMYLRQGSKLTIDLSILPPGANYHLTLFRFDLKPPRFDAIRLDPQSEHLEHAYVARPTAQAYLRVRKVAPATPPLTDSYLLRVVIN